MVYLAPIGPLCAHGHGQYLSPIFSSQFVCDNILIENNTFNNSYHGIIFLESNWEIIFENNTITNSKIIGIYVISTTVKISNSKIINSGEYDLKLKDSATIKIRNTQYDESKVYKDKSSKIIKLD